MVNTEDVDEAELRQKLRSLAGELEPLSSHDLETYGPALADYVFYPLGFLLRQRDALADETLFLVLRILELLIERAWVHALAAELFQQFSILFTSMIDDAKPSVFGISVKRQSVACLRQLYKAASGQDDTFKETSSRGKAKLSLAHSVTALLQYIGRQDVDIEDRGVGLDALKWLLQGVLTDADTLASFLPGVVSHLCRGMQRDGSLRHFSLVSKSLDILAHIIVDTCAESSVQDIPAEHTADSSFEFRRTSKWLKATESQIKLALDTISFLRLSDQVHVRRSILRFCALIYENCAGTLEACLGFLSQTILIMAQDQFPELKREADQLLDRLCSSSGTREHLKDSLSQIVDMCLLRFDRTIESHNEEEKEMFFSLLLDALKRMKQCNGEVGNFRDDLFIKLLQYADSDLENETVIEAPHLNNTFIVEESSTLVEPRLKNMKSRKLQSLFKDLLMSVITRRDVERVIRLWDDDKSRHSRKIHLIAITLLQRLDLTRINSDQELELLEIMYDHSKTMITVCEDVELLNATDVSFSLISTVQYAMRAGIEFRLELMDVLFPLLDIFGGRSGELRSNAAWALTQIAYSCEYHSVQEMLMSNMDYLVNSISLKLNVFSITPSGPMVLVILMRLLGQKSVVYMRDVIDSIFSALDTFQMYPKLVKSLFEVLETVVQEVEVPAVAERGMKHLESGTPAAEAISRVEKSLQKRQRKLEIEELEEIPNLEDDLDATATEEETSEKQLDPALTIVSRIMDRSQMFLTHGSSRVKQGILQLTTKASLILFREPNTLLPLIHSLWPLVLNRLNDDDPVVFEAAALAVAAMCESGGDFMTTRISGEAWPLLKGSYFSMYKSNGKTSGHRALSQQVDYEYAPSKIRKVRAIFDCMSSICEYVPLSLRIQDDIIETFAGELRPQRGMQDSNKRLLRALNEMNPDAYWIEIGQYQKDNA